MFDVNKRLGNPNQYKEEQREFLKTHDKMCVLKTQVSHHNFIDFLSITPDRQVSSMSPISPISRLSESAAAI